jgi:hypothetical protein
LLQLATQCGLDRRWAEQVIELQLTVAATFTAQAAQYAIRTATQQNTAAIIVANAARLAAT